MGGGRDPVSLLTAVPKEKTERDRAYLDWLATQPCCACDFPCSDPSHHGRGGMGIKASDLGALPLCRRCHDYWHATYRIRGRDHFTEERTEEWINVRAAWYRGEFERRQRGASA